MSFDLGALVGSARDIDHDGPVTLMTAGHFRAMTPVQVDSLLRSAADGELVLIQENGTNIPLHDYLRRTAH